MSTPVGVLIFYPLSPRIAGGLEDKKNSSIT